MVRNRWAGVVLAVLTLVAAGVGAVAVVRYPQGVNASAVPIVAATAVLLAAYLVVAVRITARSRRVERAASLWFGVAAGVCWSAEVWAGGPALLSHHTERVVGGTFALAAVGLSLSAGIVAAFGATRAAQVWRNGLLAGATSGALVYAFAVAMTMITAPTLAARADYQSEFARSGLPTMNAFLINDILGAAAAHLIINALLGRVGATIGRLVIASRRKSLAINAV